MQGREISFNNLYDVDAARILLADLVELGPAAAAVIIKHANPCGAAVGGSPLEAYEKALVCDPVSAFGGIVALDAVVDGELAEEISKVFTEVLISPGFTGEAREVFSKKPNMTLLEAGALPRPALASKPVTGGLLMQSADRVEDGKDYQVATVRTLREKQMEDLAFAWRVAKGVKSNAIVLARTVQPSALGPGRPAG